MKLRTDTRGGMIVIGLFLASLAVGFLYYLMGIGGAIVQREVMQDAADAGAFSAAVLHARGMNIIVLINLVMACALAILIALKILLTLLIAAIVICVALAFWTAGASLTPVPMLGNAAQTVNDIHENLKEPIFQFLRMCRQAAQIVSRAVPPAASFRAVSISRSDAYAPYVEFGVPWPLGIGNTLPVEDDRFEVLCDHAGQVVGQIVTMPFRAIGVPGAVTDMISGALGGLVSTFSGWFCSSGSGQPPDFSFDTTVDLPESPEAQRCRNDPSTCESARADMEASQPNTTTGECPDDSTAAGRTCESRAAQARTACGPAAGASNYVLRHARMRRYFWRERVGGTEVLRYTGDARSNPDDPRTQDELVSSRRVTSEGRPCRGFGDVWSETPGTDLCGHAPPTDPGFGVVPPFGRDSAVSVEYESITHVHACQVRRPEQMQMDGNRGFDPASSSDMAPQRVMRQTSDGTAVHLGEETFQIRFFAIGRTRDERGERGITIANWGRSVSRSGALEGLMLLSHVSLAQAEFFYPSSDLSDRDDWMWHMRWRARLRRFRMPAGGMSGMDGACRGVGADCGALGGLSRLDGAIAH